MVLTKIFISKFHEVLRLLSYFHFTTVYLIGILSHDKILCHKNWFAQKKSDPWKITTFLVSIENLETYCHKKNFLFCSQVLNQSYSEILRLYYINTTKNLKEFACARALEFQSSTWLFFVKKVCDKDLQFCGFLFV